MLRGDPVREIRFARSLVAAKINNYAVLGERYWAASQGRVRRMFELAQASLTATDIPQLLGYEGQAASVWYAGCKSCSVATFAFKIALHPKRRTR